jgi:hypothetical protein
LSTRDPAGGASGAGLLELLNSTIFDIANGASTTLRKTSSIFAMLAIAISTGAKNAAMLH